MYRTVWNVSSSQQRGFSLVELSIVLLIISLLIAGVITGKKILRDSELKAMLAQVNNIKTATHEFALLYHRLPGDMEQATDYWPDSANGNHDGRIESEPSDEAFLALQHLALAKFIPKSYTGAWNNGFELGKNIISLQGSGQGMYLHCCDEDETVRPQARNQHVTVFSVSDGARNIRSGAMTPVEALNMDTKLDDGLPDTGLIWGSGSYGASLYVATGCYRGTGVTATYVSADPAYKDIPGCQMHFQYDE